MSDEWREACERAVEGSQLIVRLCELELEAMEHGESVDWQLGWEELGREILYQGTVDNLAPQPNTMSKDEVIAELLEACTRAREYVAEYLSEDTNDITVLAGAEALLRDAIEKAEPAPHTKE